MAESMFKGYRTISKVCTLSQQVLKRSGGPIHFCSDQWTAANTHESSSCRVVATLFHPLSLSTITNLSQTLNPSQHTARVSHKQWMVGKIYFPSLSALMINNNGTETVTAINTKGRTATYQYSFAHNMQLFSIELKTPVSIVGQPTVLNSPTFQFITLIISRGTKQRCGASSVKAQKLVGGNQTYTVIQALGKATQGR